MTMRLSAAHLLTHPGRKPALAASEVEIQGATISAVRPAAAPQDTETLILPALTDAHDHGRGLSSIAFGALDQPLELWLPLLGLEPRVDAYLRAVVAFAHLARSGVATLNHCHNPQDLSALVDEAKAVSRAARDVGVRVAFAVPMRDRNYLAYGDPAPLARAMGQSDFDALNSRIYRPSIDQQLAWIDEIAECEHALFHVQYGPVAPQWCSDDLLGRIARASAQSGRRIHMHLFETIRQREWADAHYPSGLIRHLDAIGLISDRLTVAHGVWLRQDECEILAQRGATVSINTSSNLRLGSGTAAAAKFQSAGLKWAMGLDGMTIDDDADALRELRLLWHSQRGTKMRAAINIVDICDAVFVNGRRTVTPVSGGAVEQGMAADLVVLDYSKMSADTLDGATDVLDVIFSRARKEHVRDVIVAGRKIVEAGIVRGVDLATLERELWAQARAGWRDARAVAKLRFAHRDALIEFYANKCHCGNPSP